MTTTPRLWKSQTQVNTTDGGASQTDGQIAALPDGGYLVVWVDDSLTNNPFGDAIVGQKYDAAGTKVGGEVDLSHFPHSFTSGELVQPAVTVLANGNIAVTFDDSSSGDIYVRIFDSRADSCQARRYRARCDFFVRPVPHRPRRWQLRRLLYARRRRGLCRHGYCRAHRECQRDNERPVRYPQQPFPFRTLGTGNAVEWQLRGGLSGRDWWHRDKRRHPLSDTRQHRHAGDGCGFRPRGF